MGIIVLFLSPVCRIKVLTPDAFCSILVVRPPGQIATCCLTKPDDLLHPYWNLDSTESMERVTDAETN